jgi:hypothetical protein
MRSCQADDLLHREAGAADVGAGAVDAVGAVEDAGVGQQDLEQRDAAPVRRIGVADAHALGAGGGAGGVVFRRIGEDLELLAEVHAGRAGVHVPYMFWRLRRQEAMAAFGAPR